MTGHLFPTFFKHFLVTNRSEDTLVKNIQLVTHYCAMCGEYALVSDAPKNLRKLPARDAFDGASERAVGD